MARDVRVGLSENDGDEQEFRQMARAALALDKAEREGYWDAVDSEFESFVTEVGHGIESEQPEVLAESLLEGFEKSSDDMKKWLKDRYLLPWLSCLIESKESDSLEAKTVRDLIYEMF